MILYEKDEIRRTRLHEGIMEGIETMNFQRDDPRSGTNYSHYSRRKRSGIACAQTGTGKTGRLYASVVGPFAARGQSGQCGEIADRSSHARAGAADRYPVSGFFLLFTPFDDGRLRRWRRYRLESAETGDDHGLRHRDRYARTPAGPYSEQRGGSVARALFRARRGRSDARYGILRRYYEDRRPSCPPSGRP